MFVGNLLYVEDNWKYVTYIGSGLIFVLLITVALVVGHYNISEEIYLRQIFNSPIVPIDCNQKIATATCTLAPGNTMIIDNLIAMAFVLGLVPLAVVASINYRYLRSVETNIPRFLRDLLQSTDSGLILPKALIEASKQDYGPVSYQMGIAMTKFSLGYDFSQSIMEAGAKMRHPYASQVGQILSEAYSAGGKSHDVLSSSVNLFNDLDQYSQQRSNELKPYTQLVYISIGIYLVIALIIINSFIVPFVKTIPSTTAIATTGFGGSNSTLFNIPPGGASYFISIFYISGILEAVFAGMVAGKIVDRSAPVGLRHSIILIVITITAFSLLGYVLGYKLVP